MKTSNEFLNAIKTKHGLTSDYQLCKFLGIKSQRISFYRTGKSRFDEDTCIMVAAALDLEPSYVMACIAAERTKSAKAKAAWQHAAELLGGIAAVLAVLAITPDILSALPSMSDHESLAVAGFTLPSASRTMYIMSNALLTNWPIFAALFSTLAWHRLKYHRRPE